MIQKKLLEFQKKQIVLKKEGKNPHFNSSYVTLNEVLESVLPSLNEAGIVVYQYGDTLNGAFGLMTILYDTGDSTSISSFYPFVESTTAQKLGSNNTYNRRYALVTLLGLGDTDDDGNEASTEAPERPSKQVRDSEEQLEDGVHEVLVVDERKGEKAGKSWQRIKTEQGVAWNNSDIIMLKGLSYEVIVKGGSITNASAL